MDLDAKLDLRQNFVVALLIYMLGSAALLSAGGNEYPILHTVVDTSMFLLSGVLTLLIWDIGALTGQIFTRTLAMVFVAVTLLELLHVLVAIEWSGRFSFIVELSSRLRPVSWPPPAHLLPIGIGTAFLLRRRDAQYVWPFALGMVVLAVALPLVFGLLPRYTPPVWFGITRPFLILVPILWVAVGFCCWRDRVHDRVSLALAMSAMIFFFGNTFMLYSQAPHDTVAMVAHLGIVMANLLLLVNMAQMGAVDIAQRIRMERKLKELNEGLEQRVQERTAEIEGANAALTIEISARRKADERLHAQLARLELLHQITHAIGERQDLKSIFQVVIRSLEDYLPIDFGCVCLYDRASESLILTCVGVKSMHLAMDLTMPEQIRIPIDENGLSRSVRGELVYEPDIHTVKFPFPQRLHNGGLKSVVFAPLMTESSIFGVLIVARNGVDGFSSTDCEFLKQLSDHVALAVNQSDLYGTLQRAYDDLRQTQQAVMQQERLKALGQIASGVAHDINNAISPVMLYTELLLEREHNLSEHARGYLQIIQRAVGDVAHTVARMRDFYRQRDEQAGLAEVDLNRIVKEVLALTRPRWSDMALQEGIAIHPTLELTPVLPLVTGVESDMRDALTNLVFNAVDAMPRGGKLTLRTRIAGAPQNPSVAIEIKDEGVGMDEETRRRCLEPFFSTKGERGTGLGLAMVFGMVQRHNAGLEIESAPGIGTTMRILFDLTNIESATAEQPSGQMQVLPPQRLLLVDDDPVLLNSLRAALELDGHFIVATNGGAEGIAAFRAAIDQGEKFAAVITDLGMPYVDGRQVAAAVKEVSADTPVILLTGWGQRLITEGDFPRQADLVLSKPPKLLELRKALAQCCRTTIP